MDLIFKTAEKHADFNHVYVFGAHFSEMKSLPFRLGYHGVYAGHPKTRPRRCKTIPRRPQAAQDTLKTAIRGRCVPATGPGTSGPNDCWGFLRPKTPPRCLQKRVSKRLHF